MKPLLFDFHKVSCYRRAGEKLQITEIPIGPICSCALYGIPALIFLRRKPEDMGLLPDGEVEYPQEAERLERTSESGQAVPGYGSEIALTR